MSRLVKCYLCETKLDKNEIGLNKKINGREVTRFYCINCLANHLEISADDLLAKIEDFKLQGCTLFE